MLPPSSGHMVQTELSAQTVWMAGISVLPQRRQRRRRKIGDVAKLIPFGALMQMSFATDNDGADTYHNAIMTEGFWSTIERG